MTLLRITLLYVNRFPQGWVTDSGFVHLERVQMIMNELGRVEDQIFKKRQQDELHFRYQHCPICVMKDVHCRTMFGIGVCINHTVRIFSLQETNEREK